MSPKAQVTDADIRDPKDRIMTRRTRAISIEWRSDSRCHRANARITARRSLASRSAFSLLINARTLDRLRAVVDAARRSQCTKSVHRCHARWILLSVFPSNLVRKALCTFCIRMREARRKCDEARHVSNADAARSSNMRLTTCVTRSCCCLSKFMVVLHLDMALPRNLRRIRLSTFRMTHADRVRDFCDHAYLFHFDIAPATAS